MKKFPRNAIILASSAVGIFFSSVGAKTAEDSIEEARGKIRTGIYDITDKASIQLKFDKGTAALSESQRSQIGSLVKAFASDGKIRGVVVATYADENYPRDRKELNQGARNLATRRGESVKAQLLRSGAKDVTVYNMAEKANWFEKTFVTSDAQIKREASSAPDATSEDDAFYEALGRRLRTVGGAGKAVIVMRHAHSADSH